VDITPVLSTLKHLSLFYVSPICPNFDKLRLSSLYMMNTSLSREWFGKEGFARIDHMDAFWESVVVAGNSPEELLWRMVSNSGTVCNLDELCKFYPIAPLDKLQYFSIKTFQCMGEWEMPASLKQVLVKRAVCFAVVVFGTDVPLFEELRKFADVSMIFVNYSRENAKFIPNGFFVYNFDTGSPLLPRTPSLIASFLLKPKK
jgi:hypothetical protein